MAESRTIIVTLSDDCLDDLEKKVAELERQGFEPIELLEILGQVTGRWSQVDVKALLAIDGVESAEDSLDVSLPPPESDLL